MLGWPQPPDSAPESVRPLQTSGCISFLWRKLTSQSQNPWASSRDMEFPKLPSKPGARGQGPHVPVRKLATPLRGNSGGPGVNMARGPVEQTPELQCTSTQSADLQPRCGDSSAGQTTVSGTNQAGIAGRPRAQGRPRLPSARRSRKPTHSPRSRPERRAEPTPASEEDTGADLCDRRGRTQEGQFSRI